MFYYTAYTLSIESEISLPGFLEINESPGDVSIRRVFSVPSAVNLPKTIIVERLAGDDFLFSCPYGGLKYEIRQGKEIRICSNEINAIDIDRLPIYGFALATILHQNGFFVLHASTVEIAGKAVAVIGGKAHGKSTLIAALVARGHRLLSDDITALVSQTGKILVLPGIPCIKMWPDALQALGIHPGRCPQLYSDSIKRNYFVSDMYCPVKRELDTIFFLDHYHNDRLLMHPLSTIQKMLWISGGWYFVKFQNAFFSIEMKSMFDLCSSYARRVKMAKIMRPKNLNLLGKTCELIENYIT